MQNLAVWKTRALKWKIFLHFFMSVLPFSVKLHMHVSTMGAIFTSCILHNSREWLSTLPLKRIPLAPLLAIPSCWFVCSIVQPAEWYIVASLPVVAEVESSIIPVTGTEDLMDGVYYEAMRKVIIFAETAILCSCSLYRPSFLVWDNKRGKVTGPVFVLCIHAEGS